MSGKVSEDEVSLEDIEAFRKINPKMAAAMLRRMQVDKELEKTPPYVDALFPEQRIFFDDSAKKKAAVCSRRAGKTESVAAWLLDGGRQHADGLSLYVALSRNNCRLILWSCLEDIDRRHGLGLTFQERDNQLNVILPNGHRIWLAGCKDAKEIEKFRGIKIRRAAIDEAASFGDYIKPLIFDVLEPALLDYNGEIAVIGTPGVAPAGLFFEITTGKGHRSESAAKWSTHSWTVLDNPYIIDPNTGERHAQAYLDNLLVENNWTKDNPRYQREWEGQWVKDEGALVFPFNPKINSYQRLPEAEDDEWTYSLGIDVGFADSSAFVVGAFRRGHPEIFIVEVLKVEGLTPSAMAVQIEKYIKKYTIWMVIMDTGGIGKGYAEECSQSFGLRIVPAEKTKKRAYLEMVKGEMLSGSIKFYPPKCGPLLQEIAVLVWDEQHIEPDKRFDCHCADALLYLVRSMMPYYSPERESPVLSREEQLIKESSEHKTATERRIQRRLNSKVRLGQLMHDIASGK